MDLSKAEGLKFVVNPQNPMHLAYLHNPETVCGKVNLDALPADDSHDTQCWRCTEAVRCSDGVIRMEFVRFKPPVRQRPVGPGGVQVYVSSEFAGFKLSDEALVAVMLMDSKRWITPDEYVEILKAGEKSIRPVNTPQVANKVDYSKEIEAAADWWVKTLGRHDWTHDNGDEISSRLHSDLVKKVRRECPLSHHQLVKFKEELIIEIAEAIRQSERMPFFVGVDYEPQPPLREAAIKAGFKDEQMGLFPWKTTMSIQEGKVSVRRGAVRMYLNIYTGNR